MYDIELFRAKSEAEVVKTLVMLEKKILLYFWQMNSKEKKEGMGIEDVACRLSIA